MTKIKKEREILNVIIHLISSSRLIIDEPKEYSPMRLFSAAKYLCKLLENTDNKNIKIIIEKIVELDPVISRDYFNKPEELKSWLDNFSKLIAQNLKEND